MYSKLFGNPSFVLQAMASIALEESSTNFVSIASFAWPPVFRNKSTRTSYVLRSPQDFTKAFACCCKDSPFSGKWNFHTRSIWHVERCPRSSAASMIISARGMKWLRRSKPCSWYRPLANTRRISAAKDTSLFESKTSHSAVRMRIKSIMPTERTEFTKKALKIFSRSESRSQVPAITRTWSLCLRVSSGSSFLR